MADLSNFPITKRWPAENPDVIQLYATPTPNGMKISIALEELGLAYEPHVVTTAEADVKSPEFLSLNPNNKIPAIIDPNGPDGAPIGLFESGAILMYLADKAGKLFGSTPTQRYKITQWLFFQVGGVGPMFGQLGFFCRHGGAEMEDPTARVRYVAEAARLLKVVEQALEGKEWIADEFSIADIALAPWLNQLRVYEVTGVTGFDALKNVPAYVDRFFERPAAQKGRKIPA